MRPSRKNVHSIEPAQPRPSHEQLADELQQWLAQGNRIQQLPTGKTGQDKGKAK